MNYLSQELAERESLGLSTRVADLMEADCYFHVRPPRNCPGISDTHPESRERRAALVADYRLSVLASQRAGYDSLERQTVRLDVAARLATCSADARHVALCLLEGARVGLSFGRECAARAEIRTALRDYA